MTMTTEMISEFFLIERTSLPKGFVGFRRQVQIKPTETTIVAANNNVVT